jgi:uncharacterized protein (TIGR02646 family)
MRIERGPEPGPFRDSARYKSHLRPLFRCRCAYCLMPDDRLGGEESMTVDHFKPERWYPRLRVSWSNLYYACSVCNSHYKKDHPTPDEEAEGKRFVDPCLEDPDDHFRLVRDPVTGDLCRVVSVSSAPAEYAIFRLKLNRRKFLRDFWRSLHHRELNLLKKQDEIRQRLEDCTQLIQLHGLNDELRRLRTDYQTRLKAAFAELDSVWFLRPFPAGEHQA